MPRSLTTAAGWRAVLIYTHRWMGIGASLIFFVWFVSGVVMMYARMPRLTPDERLARLPSLDLAAVRVPIAQAADEVGVAPDRVRVGMLKGRPVYRLSADDRWTTVFADTGTSLSTLSDVEALEIVRQFMPERAATLRHAGRLTRPDQWTLDGGLPAFLPMHRVSLGDESGTFLYVSERTGEPVMKTTTSGRAWGYLGAVLHWTFFPRLREQRYLWRYGIIYTALIGCVMTLVGLIVGVWRYSPSERFRLKRVPSHSPYAGWMWWHHYAGLLFGVFALTWALSGALSLVPWDWAPSSSPTADQVEAVAGGVLELDPITPDAVQRAVDALRRSFEPREIELRQFQGRAFVTAYRPPAIIDPPASTNPDVSAIYSPVLALEHQAVWVVDGGAFREFDRDLVLRAARAAMPGVPLADGTWLTSPDAYYYDRWAPKSFPVLRARFSDADDTWLYLDGRHGLVALRMTPLARLNRWLYNGLHSFDLPFLYPRRPLWDSVVLVLSAGGLALTITTMLPAIRRLRRHLRVMVRGPRRNDAVMKR
jgi:hypothetical protein